MKSEKITKPKSTPAKRWYDDACATALALELLGERWSLLIVRELMFGPRRFGDLRASLSGVSANVLSQRLAGLEASSILVRRKLAPPANVHVYELTPWGYELEPAIQALGAWALRSPQHDPTLPFSSASLMLSFRTKIDRTRSGDHPMTAGFRLGPEHFVADVDASGIAIRREPATAPDFHIAADPTTIASVVYGGRPLAHAESTAELVLTGDRALAEHFVTLFPLPPKIA
ncbi:MAG: helix-turn-helix domain-containing protein [Myxococcota bacterium]